MQVTKQRYWINPPSIQYGWRPINPYCLTYIGNNTGQQGWNDLEEYNLDDGIATGNTKLNVINQLEYVAPISNETTCPIPLEKAWRPINPYCVKTGVDNTGYYAYSTLEEYYVDTLQATGVTKSNVQEDANYIAPTYNITTCPLPIPPPVLAWRVTDMYCIKSLGDNTGDKAWSNLREYNVDTEIDTGVIKPNALSDPDYVAPIQDFISCPLPLPVYAWRGINQYCVQSNGVNTGYQKYNALEQYDVGTGIATGSTKSNVSFDIDYIAPVYNETTCPLPVIEDTYAWEGYQPFCETIVTAEPIPDEPFPPPVENCRVHFSGLLMSDIIIQYIEGDSDPLIYSKIYEEDIYSEFVGSGEYPDNELAFPKAVSWTFDGIAIDVGTRLIIYEGKNFTGNILLNIIGPKLIYNEKWNTSIGYGPDYRAEKEKTFTEPLQTNYPQSVRIWSNDDMHSWKTGSSKITCI